MKVEDLMLAGLDTKELIYLGPGLRTWPLLAFQGPVFQPTRVGGPDGRPYFVLPRELLACLYERFAMANPSGCAICDPNEMDGLIYAHDVPEAERERLWDAGEVGWDVFDWRIPPHGRDPIRRYLPELFEPAVLQRILSDPRLDMAQKPPKAPADYADYWQDKSRHFRWSDWWNER
ncbi:MAG: hypothetical protein ACK4F7_02100 [Inhella sp.]